MQFKGGIKEAAKLLAGLPPKNRASVLEIIARKDPGMAADLEKHLVSFEDLKLITVKMLQELLREIAIDDLALGLRAASDELKSFILGNVSSTMKKDILDVLNGPLRSVNDVQNAQEKIMMAVRPKVDNGTIVFRGDDEEYV